MWYDLVIFGLLLFCTVRGAAKGFVWQLAAIGALVICFLFAETASVAIAPHINLAPPLNRWVAMFVLYLGASFASFALARTVRRTLESMQFVEYDRHLGAVFGLLKGVGFALVITFFAVTLSESLRGQVLTSYSGYASAYLLSALEPVMPAELHTVIDPYLERLGAPVAHDHDGADAGGDFGEPPVYGGTPGVPAPPADDFGPMPDGFGPAPLPFDPRGSQPVAPRGPALTGAPTSPSRGPAPPAAGGEFGPLVRALPGVDDQVKNLALTALQNTRPEDRDELLSKFKTAIPGLIHAAASEWQNGKPETPTAAGPREETLREVAAIYTDKLDGQASIIREAEGRLRGVPDPVALVVVQDWYADLLELTPDPDPQTSLATPLDLRIVRQLRSFRVPVESLSADLRGRLEGPSRR